MVTLSFAVAALALFLMFRTKAWGMGLVCVLAGILLASTSAGQSVRQFVVNTVTSVDKTIN